MRNLLTVLAVAVVMGVPATLFAQERDEALVVRIQDIQLTDAQEARIAEIRKECRPEVEKAAKELAGVVREELTKIRAVLTAEQKEKLAALKKERKERRQECLAHRLAHCKHLDLTGAERAKIAEIRKEFRPKITKAMEGLKGLLTEEQRQARADALKAGKKRREVLAALKLTDDQKGKVETVGKEVGALVREELKQVRDVLTEGQKEKLQELREETRERVRNRMAHRIANAKSLELTDDQKAQITKIRQEYRPKVQEAGNNLRGVVREEAQKILAVIRE
jgi:Spy/CpxP family protein refolding chaperone